MAIKANPYAAFLPHHQHEYVYNPGHIVHHRCDLFNDKNGSDKVYILQIEELTTTTFAVVAYYGKRNSNLTTKMYELMVSFSQASTALAKRRDIKRREGYTLYSEGAILNKNIAHVGATGFNKNMIAMKLAGDMIILPEGNRYPKIQSYMQASSFRRQSNATNAVLFEMPSNEFFYMFFELPGSWLLTPQKNFNLPIHSMDIIHPSYDVNNSKDIAREVGPAVFVAVHNPNGKPTVLDLVAFQGLNVEKLPWTTRRGMMNAIYDIVYPGVDPYDPSLEVPFLEYHYENRDEYLDEYFGSSRKNVLYSTAITNNLFNHKAAIHQF